MFHVFRVLPPCFSRDFSKSHALKFLQDPGPLHREKDIYDDAHLASLGASLFQVPEPMGGGGGEFFQIPGPIYLFGYRSSVLYHKSIIPTNRHLFQRASREAVPCVTRLYKTVSSDVAAIPSSSQLWSGRCFGSCAKANCSSVAEIFQKIQQQVLPDGQPYIQL